MKASSTIFLGGLLLAGAMLPARAATPVIGSQLFAETDARIDDLFHYRTNPPKPPGPMDDPFRVGDAPLASNLNLTGTGTGPLPPGASDDAILRQAAGSLVFGGILQVGEVQVLVINKASYKEGGILSVRVQGNPVYLRILSITGNSVTLGLNDARLTLHF
jgi:hypothetical protein